MSKTMTFEEFRYLIADHLGIEFAKLTPHVSFLHDLGIDSLSMINFIIKMEKKYAIKINLDTVWKMKTVHDAYELFLHTLNET